MPEPRFLVVRLSSLGDIVHTFPAVAGLRESFPASEIIWLTHPRWKVLVECSSLASQVWTTETRSLAALRATIRRVRESEFHAAIDYQGLWKSATLPFFGGVKRRVGFSSSTVREFGVPILYTDRVHCAATHIADQNGELSVRAGARKGVANYMLRIPSQAEAVSGSPLPAPGFDGYIVLSPGGGWRSKCWPAERFGALCRMIRNSLDIRCVVNYGPGEEQLAGRVRDASGDAAPLLYNGDLRSLMILLRNARCIVGGDTGPLHLAIALGAPVVALFGPTDPARNGPYRITDQQDGSTTHPVEEIAARDIVLRAPHAITTHRRSDQTDPAMLAIQVEEVLDAVHRRIGAPE
ncbi:MAG TPA: glycosyltransferase family 9 protein [Candidatus Dormibacteraeota bacterium]|nr:glycosyltransferase family 9 protein [Candidatus Dormibacteraeota bacterium]